MRAATGSNDGADLKWRNVASLGHSALRQRRNSTGEASTKEPRHTPSAVPWVNKVFAKGVFVSHSTFKTTNAPLAATLLVCGFNLLASKPHAVRGALHIFERNEALRDCLDDYFSSLRRVFEINDQLRPSLQSREDDSRG
jgi:hypothetical protein